jgi:uncharacterized membrane protein YhaH (DUF805 family)
LSNIYAAPAADLVTEETFAETMPFEINGRIGRLRYLAYGVGAYFIISIVMGLAMIPFLRSGAESALTAVWLPLIIAGVMLVVYTVIARRRMHDIGLGGWYVLGLFIPIVNLYFGLMMLFKRGDEGANEFGLHPSPNTLGVKILAFLLPGVALLGIVAAIVIPTLR